MLGAPATRPQVTSLEYLKIYVGNSTYPKMPDKGKGEKEETEKDELAALDALDKEASEYKKVCLLYKPLLKLIG